MPLTAKGPDLLDPIDEMLVDCLHVPDAICRGHIESVCAEDPATGQELRRRFERLISLGLLDAPGASGSDAAESVPDRLGNYRFVRRLGDGGMGVVYEVHDEKLGRRVALKLIRDDHRFSARSRERFEREIRAASRLDHEHLCPIYEAGEIDGVPYIAMRYVPGETLAQRIARAAPGSNEDMRAIALAFEKVARALHEAHEVGLIHRDVKPGNIMMTEEGEPVLLDFGLAREERDDGPTLTNSGDLLGTPAYMSPEQLMAGRVPLDRRTDVYSLGASLYQALTLRTPFRAPTRAELYQRILHTDPPSARSIQRQIPSDLEVVLATAMEKDRDRRYQTALELAEDLRRWREFEPIRARPIGRLLRARRWARRHPTATVALVLLSVGVVASLVGLARIRDQLRTQTALNLVAESRQALEADSVRALELALRAHELAPDSRRTISNLHHVLGQGVPIATIRNGGDHGGFGFWSGDGRRFLHVAIEQSTGAGPAEVGDADFDDMVPVLAGKAVHAFRCGFSSSGRYVYGLDADGRVHAWDHERAEPVEVNCSAEVGTSVQALSALDRLIVRQPAGRLAVYDLETASECPLSAHLPSASSNVAVAATGPTFAVGLSDTTLAVFSSNELVARSDPLDVPAVRVAYALETGRVVGVLPGGGAAMWATNANYVEPLPECDGTLDAEFSRDGQWLLTLHDGGLAKLRDGTGQLLHVLKRPDESPSPLYLRGGAAVPRHFSNSRSKARICVLYRDLATSIWDLSGRHIVTLPGIPGYEPNWAEWSADGTALFLSQGPPALRMFDPDGRPKARLAPSVRGSMSPDGSMVFAGGRIWALLDPDVPSIQAHAGIVRGLAAAGHSGRIVATASDDATGRVWERESGTFERIDEFGASERVLSVDLDPSGDLVLFGCDDGRVHLRRTRDSSVLFSRRIEALDRVSSVSIAPDGRRFAVSRVWRGTHVYDVESGERLFSTSDGGSGVHLTNRHLLIAAKPAVQLFTAEGQFVREFDPSAPGSLEARLSPDDNVVVCARGSEIWVYEQTPSEEWPEQVSAILRGHDAAVQHIRFHPDGDRIVSTSADGTARIWSLSERAELAVLQGHEGPVRAGVFVDDGERVLTTGADGTLRTWITDEDDLLEVAKRRLTAVR